MTVLAAQRVSEIDLHYGHGPKVGGPRGQVDPMRRHYDFTKATRNPYAARLKRQVTIRLDEPTIAAWRSSPRWPGPASTPTR